MSPKTSTALICFILMFQPHAIHGKFYKTNITDFSSCKVHYTRQESSYKTFYELSEPTVEELLVDFHCSVLAISDAHILLATSDKVTKSDAAYEIVIGAGGNSFSDIRRKQKGNVRVSYRNRGLLSAVDVTSFWIHIYKNGLIDVGREGEEIGFMSWTDTEVIPVKVFSFSAWSNVEAKWFFDCPHPGENGTNSKKLRPPTEFDRLKEYILNLNESHNDIVTVNIELTSHFINLNEKESILNIKGRANFSWTFTPIKWNPANFSGIKTVVLHHGELWKPDLIITNAIDVDHYQPFNGELLIANHDGRIMWQPTFDIYTYCSMDGIENWPNDEHNCDIFISTGFAQNALVIFEAGMAADTLRFPAAIDESEWYLKESPNVHIYRSTNNEYLVETYVNRPQGMKLQLAIKRNPTIFQTAFQTPLWVIATLMLINFWCSPFDYIKMSIISAQFILTTLSSIGLASILPAHREKIPYIVYQYCAVMVANIINLIITVIVINLSRNIQILEPPHIIGRVVKSNVLEKILLLPELTPKIVSSSYPASMETVRRRTLVQDVWIRLGMVIDRIAFITYLSLTLSLFFAN